MAPGARGDRRDDALRALLKESRCRGKREMTVDGDEVECLALVPPHGDDGDRDMAAEIDMGHGVERDDARRPDRRRGQRAPPGC